MDSLNRLSKIKEALSGLLSLPCFATNLLVLDDRGFDALFEETVSHIFLQSNRNTLIHSKNKDNACDMLEALSSLLKNESFFSTPANESYNLRKYKNKFRRVKDHLLNAVVSDFSHLFRVDIKGRTHLRKLYQDGCVMIRKLRVIASGSFIASLFPTIFLATLKCACVMASRIKLYHPEESEIALISNWIPRILRVWLHSIDKAVVNEQEKNNSEREDEESQTSVDTSIAFVLGARHVFQTAIFYAEVHLKNDTVSEKRLFDVSNLTFEEVAYDDISSMYAVISSMHDACIEVLDMFCCSSQNHPSFQSEQLKIEIRELKCHLKSRNSAVSEGEELERMRGLIEGMQSLVTRCTGSGPTWCYHDFDPFQLCFRSNRFVRKEVFSLNVHVLVSLAIALFFQSTFFIESYESHVRILITEAFEHCLRV